MNTHQQPCLWRSQQCWIHSCNGDGQRVGFVRTGRAKLPSLSLAVSPPHSGCHSTRYWVSVFSSLGFPCRLRSFSSPQLPLPLNSANLAPILLCTAPVLPVGLRNSCKTHGPHFYYHRRLPGGLWKLNKKALFYTLFNLMSKTFPLRKKYGASRIEALIIW